MNKIKNTNSKRPEMSNQDGYILGYPVDFWSAIINAGYLIAVVAAAAFSVLVWRISIISGAAKDRALEAYKARASVEIAQASAHASAADEKAAEAALNVAKANQEIARLNLEDSKLKAQNLALEAQIAPREIKRYNPMLYIALGRLAPKTVLVRSYNLDGEGAIFAGGIINGLKSQNFNVQDGRMQEASGQGIFFGVWVFGNNKPLVTALVEFFQSAGVIVAAKEPNFGNRMVFGMPVQPQEKPDAEIFVGMKPLEGMKAAQ